MRFSTGFLVVVAAAVLFYFRIAQLKGRKKRYEREFALKRRRVNGRSKGSVLPATAPGSPPYQVKNWLLVVLSILLMIFGLILYNSMIVFGVELVSDPVFLETYTKLWYIPVAAGIILLAFCVTIRKPEID